MREGRFPLDHARGLAGRSATAQAAELFVRRELELDAVDALTIEAEDGERVTLGVPGRDRPVVVRARRESAGERALSCAADAKVEDPGRWVVEPLS